MLWPCSGPKSRVRRINISSVPWSRSTRVLFPTWFSFDMAPPVEFRPEYPAAQVGCQWEIGGISRGGGKFSTGARLTSTSLETFLIETRGGFGRLRTAVPRFAARSPPRRLWNYMRETSDRATDLFPSGGRVRQRRAGCVHARRSRNRRRANLRRQRGELF